mmetsp:Transcript_26835/g.73797  ORF Transcript_26835/g.73797 Transcript_26835/m.73797 type:complete len:222 (-) Transcript_26835:620-1285(-)
MLHASSVLRLHLMRRTGAMRSASRLARPCSSRSWPRTSVASPRKFPSTRGWSGRTRTSARRPRSWTHPCLASLQRWMTSPRPAMARRLLAQSRAPGASPPSSPTTTRKPSSSSSRLWPRARSRQSTRSSTTTSCSASWSAIWTSMASSRWKTSTAWWSALAPCHASGALRRPPTRCSRPLIRGWPSARTSSRTSTSPTAAPSISTSGWSGRTSTSARRQAC